MSKLAFERLRKEFVRLQKAPPPHIEATPLDSDILTWHYCITGPKDSPYEGGIYHGIIKFPPQYPMKPPSIQMCTPNGRFKTDTRLCLSMSDFHPESWNPLWSVSSILSGLLSFMLENTPTAGSVDGVSDATRREYALRSWDFNLNRNPVFRKLFPHYIERAKERQQRMEGQGAAATAAAATPAAAAAAPAAVSAPAPAPAADSGLRHRKVAEDRKAVVTGATPATAASPAAPLAAPAPAAAASAAATELAPPPASLPTPHVPAASAAADVTTNASASDPSESTSTRNGVEDVPAAMPAPAAAAAVSAPLAASAAKPAAVPDSAQPSPAKASAAVPTYPAYEPAAPATLSLLGGRIRVREDQLYDYAVAALVLCTVLFGAVYAAL